MLLRLVRGRRSDEYQGSEQSQDCFLHYRLSFFGQNWPLHWQHLVHCQFVDLTLQVCQSEKFLLKCHRISVPRAEEECRCSVDFEVFHKVAVIGQLDISKLRSHTLGFL